MWIKSETQFILADYSFSGGFIPNFNRKREIYTKADLLTI